MALEILEEGLNDRMEAISNKLVNDIFLNTKNIETADLDAIRKRLHMNRDFEDIYIINQRGVVVNTTFSTSGSNIRTFCSGSWTGENISQSGSPWEPIPAS